MAIRLEIQASKKIPIPGNEFSSQQASISLSGEVSNPNEVVAESLRLYALAEKAVNLQLKLETAPIAPVQPRPSQPSQPYQQRRAMITDSQLRFLNTLIKKGNHSVDAILHDFQIGNLRDLSCKDAVGLIDRLKTVSV